MRCLSLSTPVYLSLFLSVCLSLSLSVSVSFELLEGDITEPEVYTAVRALKNGKAAGPDGIIGEFFKTSATLVVPFLVKFFNRLFTTGSYPQAWSEAIIHPLLKKATLTTPIITGAYLC